MQGLQSLNQFKNFVSKIGGLGRYEDTYIVHAAEGETVVPMEVLDQNPVLKKRLFKTMMEMGIEPGRYIVGNELNSKNPVTGQPEFFLKQIGRRLRKAAADISGYAAPIIGAMYGPAAGAITGGLLGQYKRENPGDPTQGLNMALRGGLTGLATNLATGQPLMQMGGGMRGAYGTADPVEMGRRMLNLDSISSDYKGDVGMEGNKKDDKYKFMDFLSSDEVKKLKKLLKIKEKGLFGDMSIGQLAKLYGLGTAGLGLLIQLTDEKQDVGLPEDTMPQGNVLTNILNPTKVYAASGGVMDLQDGGESKGPGTGTSDSIPAMLSDGEFVMTAKAVRGAGGGDRREGARKMYEAMDRLEARA